MGTDISGFVECRPRWSQAGEGETTPWEAALDLFLLDVTRNYDAFGCLFGVRNHAGFRPLAAGRGMPADASEPVRAELEKLAPWPDQAHSVTWITWAEVKRVDWDEPAETADRRVHRFQRTSEGRLRYVGKAVWDADHAAALGAPDTGIAPADGWPEGTEWAVEDTVFRVQRIRRRDAVPPDGEWQPVWAVMETLAALHGDDNVRLVVWFDY